MLGARCARDAETRFDSDIFNHRGAVQEAERPYDMQKVNGAALFTSIIRW